MYQPPIARVVRAAKRLGDTSAVAICDELTTDLEGLLEIEDEMIELATSMAQLFTGVADLIRATQPVEFDSDSTSWGWHQDIEVLHELTQDRTTKIRTVETRLATLRISGYTVPSFTELMRRIPS